MLSGSRQFCREFLTDVRVPDSDRVGDVDDGWKVGTRWMFHERTASDSPYTTMQGGGYRPIHGRVGRNTGHAPQDHTRHGTRLPENSQKSVIGLGAECRPRPAGRRPMTRGRVFRSLDADGSHSVNFGRRNACSGR